jgi:hypothetical protein
MSLRLNSCITYKSRANIFSPVKKNHKINKIIFDNKEYLYDKIHEHFSKLDSIKLDEFGDDEETYGNIIIKGVIYGPRKIKLNYLENRARQEEEEKVKGKINLNNIFNFDDDDNKFEFINSSFKKPTKRTNNIIPQTSKIHLPLLRNKNKSTGNIHSKKFNNVNISKIIKNKKINIDKKINENINENINNNYNNKNINSYNDKNIKINLNNFAGKDINKDIIYNNSNSETNINSLNSNEETDRVKENNSKIIKNKSYINLKKELKLPILHNKINVTSKNMKLFLLANKFSVKTDDNKINQLLKRNKFIKRYDDSTGLNNKLNELNNNIIKINEGITRVINKNNEDILQFNLRFNNLFKLFDK